MTIALSNAYVEKASSEQPTALWTLNDKVDYVSHISEEERKIHLFALWEVVGADATSVSGTSIENTPFIDSATTRIEGAPPPSPSYEIVLRSKFSISENFVQRFENFVIGTHIYVKSEFARYISVGYQYEDPQTEEIIEVLQTTPVFQSNLNSWNFLSKTVPLPPDNATDIKYLIKFGVVEGGLEEQYDFFINGLVVGQWAEEFVRNSYGVTLENLPPAIALPDGIKTVPAFPYGTSGQNGYYLSKDYELFSKNFGVPMVYGSSNVTKIYPHYMGNDSVPSIIFPGYGFFNEKGRFNNYTLEMWLKINSAASSAKKIFGPIGSEDGLYVDDAYLVLKLGEQYQSYFIGEWFRPMLIHIRFLRDSLVLVLNGEEIISMEIDRRSVTLPLETLEGKSQDWLGFYAYDDVPTLELDSFSIYPYGLPTQVMRRHFVWGQAITPPEQTNSAINSITAFNDYAFAKYAANYNYPDFANFVQGFGNNVLLGSRSLSLPEYSLPEFVLADRGLRDLFSSIQNLPVDENDEDDELGRKYLTLKESTSEEEYIYFETLNVLSETLDSVYGIFKTDGSDENKPLIKIRRRGSDDYLLINISGTSLLYYAYINGVENIIDTKIIEPNKKFIAGINIPKLLLSTIQGIAAFFADLSSLDMYIAGDSEYKFLGNIYKIALDGRFNSKEIEQFYNSNGTFKHDAESAESLFDHTANYTLVAIEKYNLFFADIAVSGYWEDYSPLSYFAKYVLDTDGTSKYDLDVMQFNLDFPEPNSRDVVESTPGWIYSELFASYRSPSVRTYSDLNNKFFTQWEDYQDMSEQSIKTVFFNTSKSTLQTYISFQEVRNGANRNLSEFQNTFGALANGIVDPDGSSQNWETTAYEITNGTIIYPPTIKKRIINNTEAVTPIDFNDVALVYHLKFKSEGIFHQPLRVRDLQIASQVFERTSFTPVGSKFGVPVFYYSKSGIYFDLKGKNPVRTYKRSTPHLYLSRQTGWKLKGQFDQLTDRGIAMPVNSSGAFNTEVSSVQMWVLFEDRQFPGDRVKVFSIDHNDGIYDFYIQADESLQRGLVKAYDRETDIEVFGLNYFINGTKVNTPILVKDEWAVIAIEFPDLLDFSGRAGLVSMNGPLVYNNISYNLATNLEKDEQIENRLWGELTSVYQANVTNAIPNAPEQTVTYLTNKPFDVGDIVTISGATPAEYNVENAEILEVSGNNFVIAGTRDGAYSAGGKATTSNWGYAQTDLPVNDDSEPPYTWKNVEVLFESRTFNINPEGIYAKYTGSDRIVVDDANEGILVKPESFTLFESIVWNQSVQSTV